MHLGDDGRRPLDAPAHGLEAQLQLGGGQLGAGLFESGIDTVVKDVVVFEEAVTQRSAQGGGHLEQTAVAHPGRGVEQLLALLLGQALLRRAAFVTVGVLVVAAPLDEALLEGLGDGSEVGKSCFAELFLQRGAQVFIARRKA